MSKKYMVPIILIGLGLVFCETGIEIDLSTWVKQTATAFRTRSQLLGEQEWPILNLTWGWTVQKPEGDSIIIERSPGQEENYIFLASTEVDTVMTYTDNDTVIKCGTWYKYRLSISSNSEINTIKEINVDLPWGINIWRPSQDTLSVQNDTLEIRWQLYNATEDFKLEIFKTDTLPVDLMNLVNPAFSMTTSDTVAMVEFPDSLFPPLSFYIIKVTYTELVEFITDTSVGFRAFFRLP